MSKGYKFGQIVGIVLGVIAGSMIVNAFIAPKPRSVYVVDNNNPQQYNQQPYQTMQPSQGVFEQALSAPKS
jgi:hypothetical protein